MKFSIDACSNILNVKSDNVLNKCRSVYVLADDLIEEKKEWLEQFIPSETLKVYMKMKTPVRRGIMLRGIKMAIESVLGGARLNETQMKPPFLPDCLFDKAYSVFYTSFPEVSITAVSQIGSRYDQHQCLCEHQSFLNGLSFCLQHGIVPPTQLACEYDTFYHTRYPERAKEFDRFVEKVFKLNGLEPNLVARHTQQIAPQNGMDYPHE